MWVAKVNLVLSLEPCPKDVKTPRNTYVGNVQTFVTRRIPCQDLTYIMLWVSEG